MFVTNTLKNKIFFRSLIFLTAFYPHLVVTKNKILYFKINKKMNLKVIILLVLVRIASVFIVQTYFSPDEYWQSLEVAHKLTFG